jgi:uncharacterized protein (UPF0548 family)
MRQVELWQRPVTYAAIGATQAADLIRYPPRGYRPVERRARIGHGDDRFAFASLAIMTWGVQKNSGFEVQAVETPSEVTDMTYIPVAFDAAGEPVTPAMTGNSEEVVFSEDGTAAVTPGDTAILRIPFGPWRVKAPVRVVYVVDEPARKGFAYGTLEGHPEDGEESWVIDRRDDGSVWMTIRAFSRPATPMWWLVYPVLRLSQEFYTRRYLRALAGPIG